MKRSFFNILLFFFLLFSGNAIASHIVGGEIQMIHQRGETYLLRLILYYDQANAEFNLIDKEIELGIYRKQNNNRVDDTKLEITSSFFLDYSNPNCLPDSLKTIKIIYEGIHRFAAERYSDAEGYYLSWERCCRNNIISNVFQPGRQGMVFLLEFPSIGEYPLNSSPTFKPVQGEYICRDRYIEMDYGAFDADGDSLKYSLAIPLAGFTTPDNPMSNLTGGPYPLVENYFLMPGSPFLRIDARTGILSVKPSQNGLYVFRVICEEFREGKRIGATHRDFQILVNNCEDNFSPVTKIFDRNNNAYFEGDTLFIDSRDDLCFDVLITDRNAESQISYEIVPINFESKTPTFSPNSGSIPNANDTMKVKMCWPDCVEPDDQDHFEFYLLVKDNACPLRNTDSTRVILKVSEESNQRPVLYSEYLNIEWPVGRNFEMRLEGNDADSDDSLSFSFRSAGNELQAMLSQNNYGNNVDGSFSFIADCGDLRGDPYNFMLYLSDNSCASNKTDSLPFAALINDYIPYERSLKAPANIITPNGDSFNEYFFFSQPDEGSCEFQTFESLIIYNRWGIEVFRSEDRDFKWYAEEVPSGEYFYLIKFDNSAYKGFIHVIK